MIVNDDLSKNPTNLPIYSITAEELKSPLRQSKHHKTTIISIISLFAYHHLILASNQGNNMSPSDTIRLDTCINTRPYSTPELPWTEKGAYVSESYLNSNTDNYPELDFGR
ncbi:unnamed protein product [Rhizophagus irregularis]|nr:unnamed protein product [Rhizophagus irregularis]